MTDRSLVRFAGLCGILLALTSWTAVVVFYAGGSLVTFQLLYALIAVWSLFAIAGLRHRIRDAGQGWAVFATVVGIVAACGTIAGALNEVGALRATGKLLAVNPANPYGLMTFGLTGLWFLIASILMWRSPFPRLLVALGFVAFADLFVGFVAALVGIPIPAIGTITTLDQLAAVIAGAVGGPIFWLWLGILLWREGAAA